ncbi:hypothetical protein RIF29_10714 [Crotalaria pallida]|uniref:DUF4228 domain-containing protein n=1 Tax=Crotalaria pallida TaxID=3830 RepID=A0AAN9FW10_CROPI
MGNCLRNNKITSAQDHENYDSQVAPSSADVKVEKIIKASSSSLPKLEALPKQKEQGMKKKVRFDIQNEYDEGDDRSRGSCTCHADSRSGVVRIKVVMTQKELKRMLLSCKKDEQHTTSLEQLLSAVMLRGGRISEVCEFNGGMNNSWRPALESIPEDR